MYVGKQACRVVRARGVTRGMGAIKKHGPCITGKVALATYSCDYFLLLLLQSYSQKDVPVKRNLNEGGKAFSRRLAGK
jgi:hypothetical protein